MDNQIKLVCTRPKIYVNIYQVTLAKNTFAGLKKLFSGRGSPDFSALTPNWNEFKLDTLQHKTVLKVITETIGTLLGNLPVCMLVGIGRMVGWSVG